MYQTSSYRDSTRPPIPPIQKGLKFWPWSSTTFFFLSRPYHITLHGWFAWLGAGSICTEAEAQYEARQVTAAVQKAGSFQQKSQHRTVMGSGSLVSLLFFHDMVKRCDKNRKKMNTHDQLWGGEWRGELSYGSHVSWPWRACLKLRASQSDG